LVWTPPGVPVTSPPAQPDFSFRRNCCSVRLATGNEFVDLAESARGIRGLAMIDRAKHEIGGALERRTFHGDAGRRARLADEAAVFLRIFVHAVAAQGQERGARRYFAVTLVQPAQERAAAIEFIVETGVPRIDAVIGNAA
jgi:hypothetical protein